MAGAASAGATFYFLWEPALILWIQAHLGSIGQALATFFSLFGEPVLTIAIIGFFYWGIDKELGKVLGLSAALGTVINSTLKNIFVRRRPYFDHPDIKCLKAPEAKADIYDISIQSYSFPSGHSANAAAMFGAIAVYLRKKWAVILGIALPVAVAISRICLGVHYPTDVIAGLAIGFLSVILVYLLHEKVRSKVLRSGILLACAVPGLFLCRSNDYFSGLGLLVGMIFGCILEEKVVQFENTRRPFRVILRLVGGVAIYLALNALLKLPFSEEFLNSATAAQYAVRAVRYGIISFVEMGIYPLVFRCMEKLSCSCGK